MEVRVPLNPADVSSEEIIVKRMYSHQNVQNRMVENPVWIAAPSYGVPVLIPAEYQYEINMQYTPYAEIFANFNSYGANIKSLKFIWSNESDPRSIEAFINLASSLCPNLKELYLYSELSHDHGIPIPYWHFIGFAMNFPMLEHLHLECLNECHCGENGFKDNEIGTLLRNNKSITKLTLIGFHLEASGLEVIATELPDLKEFRYHGKKGWDYVHKYFETNIVNFDQLATLSKLEVLDIQDYRMFQIISLITGLAACHAPIEKLTLKRLKGDYLEKEDNIFSSIVALGRTLKSLKMSSLADPPIADIIRIAGGSDLTEFEFDMLKPVLPICPILAMLRETTNVKKITVNQCSYQ